jgi:hypothetical protein
VEFHKIQGAGKMYNQLSSREQISDNADFTRQLREQDEEFCRRMLIAIESGRENCPVGISKEPCTKKPVLADGWKQM